MTPDKKYKAISQMNVGRMAAVAATHLSSLVQKKTLDTLLTMRTEYRSGNFNAIKVQCLVAQLCILEDLENALSIQVNQGEKATQQVNEGDDQ